MATELYPYHSKRSWQECFTLYKLFKEEHGREPKLSDSPYQGVNLGNWVKNQRTAFKKGVLSKEQRQQLLAAGFELTPQEAAWYRAYTLYKDFKTELGREPMKGDPLYHGVDLGNWVNHQRQASRKGTLSAERKQILSEAGFVFDFIENVWLERFALYKAYKSEGRGEPRQGELYHGVDLGSWVSTQRQSAKKGILSEEKRQQLTAVGFIFDLHEATWQANYEAYIAFKSENSREPQQGETYLSFPIGDWVDYQRQAFKKGILSESRAQKLLVAGFLFDPRDAYWHNAFELYKGFKDEFGHEPRLDELYRGFKLGTWVGTQKAAFKNGTLSQDRAEKLMAAGFIVSESQEAVWQQKFELYKAFKCEHDREPLLKEQYQGINLGQWVKKQRNSYKGGKLPESRKQKLLEAGFVFNMRFRPKTAWHKNFEAYKAFKAEYDREPREREPIYHGVHLGEWVKDQRRAFKKGLLSENRMEKLLAAGFTFDLGPDATWQKNFNLYVSFKSEYQREPKLSDPPYQGVNLGNWVVNQRHAFKKGTLSQDREEKLLAVGFSLDAKASKSHSIVSDSRETIWQKRLELYKAFKSEYPREPRDKEQYQGFNLGRWVCKQRLAFSKGTLSEERRQKLLDAGFVFDIHDRIWQKNFETYKEFMNKYGRKPKYGERYQGINISYWIISQRFACKKGTLSADRKQKLLEAGFDFKISSLDERIFDASNCSGSDPKSPAKNSQQKHFLDGNDR